jgi:hypothetical protein
VGLKEALKKLERVENTYGKRGERMKPVIKRACRRLRASVRSVTPVGPTGNLRRMMGATLAKHYPKDEPFGFVWAFAPHSHLIEYGHIGPGGSHVPAHPFFKRGIDKGTPGVLKMIEKEIEAILKKATG